MRCSQDEPLLVHPWWGVAKSSAPASFLWFFKTWSYKQERHWECFKSWFWMLALWKLTNHDFSGGLVSYITVNHGLTPSLSHFDGTFKMESINTPIIKIDMHSNGKVILFFIKRKNVLLYALKPPSNNLTSCFLQLNLQPIQQKESEPYSTRLPLTKISRTLPYTSASKTQFLFSPH